MKKYSVPLIILLIIVVAGFVLWYATSRPSNPPAKGNQQVACTMEAKICPDGSAVGRSGPACEFAPCPTITTPQPPTIPSDWKTSSKDGVTFRYPAKLATQFTTPQDWPPVVTVDTTGVLDCRESGSEINAMGKIEKRTINGAPYCVHTESEGAAGSTYTHYIYVTMHNGVLVSVDAILRYVQCLNYPEPNASECQKERADFNFDTLVEQIVSTVK